MKIQRTCLLGFLLLIGLAPRLHAGTEIKAFLQSYSGGQNWVNLRLSIQQDQLRLDWKGPLSKGSLLYDRDSSQIALVDPLHHSLFLLPAADQTTLKLALALFAGQLKKKSDGADATTRRDLELAAKNARSFFNGTPQMEKQGETVGGFSCDAYLTRDDQGGKMRETWVAPSEKTGMAPEDYNTFRSLAHLVLELCDPLLAQWGADTVTFKGNLTGSDFPVQELLYAKGRLSAKYKTLGVQAKDFDPGVFQLPNGYKNLGLLDLLK